MRFIDLAYRNRPACESTATLHVGHNQYGCSTEPAGVQVVRHTGQCGESIIARSSMAWSLPTDVITAGN
jgi:hypothetical protein